MQGRCLVSQELREKISEGAVQNTGFQLARDEPGFFTDSDLENRIQPASFEPRLGDELFILDTERRGAFLPLEGTSVYHSLLRLPRGQRVKVPLTDSGFELKSGFTYLVPLQERISLKQGEHIHSSPKSSTGRVFLRARMISDYNTGFEEIHPSKSAQSLQPWLLLQPCAFNVIIYPGMTLNQLRWFEGNASLSQDELEEAVEKHNILKEKSGSGLIPLKPKLHNGVQIHLDLSGEHMNGIVALRARRNPTLLI